MGYNIHMQKRGVIDGIFERPFAFALTFLILFGVTFIFLSLVGATPEPAFRVVEDGASGGTQTTPGNPESPVRIVAPSVNLDQKIVNPTSIDIGILDKALEEGAVRYPTSAQLGVDGTVLLFGHSTSIPVVRNQYYKTFNDIQKLKTGAVVSVYSGTTEYRYTVTGVRVADATDDIIELKSDNKYLTLVTCNSFAAKSSRFVVTATLEGAYTII